MPENQNDKYLCLPRRSPQEWLRGKFHVDTENIPRLVYPLAKFIHEEKPDYVLAIDSGARITGLALFAFYHELYGELPTKDHRIHFRKISHSFPAEVVRRQLKPDICEVMSSSESPLLFVVDDCVNTGTTTLMLRLLVSELSEGKVRLKIGVMREFLAGVTDVRGDTFSLARATWRNNSQLIGVEYTDKIIPHVMRTAEAANLRREIFTNVRGFASKIKSRQI